MTDVEYDALELEVFGSNNPSDANPTGTDDPQANETKLPIPMPSLAKLKTETEINKWFTKHDRKRVKAQLKYNGISGGLFGDRIYVRGNGLYGTDITEILKTVKNPCVELLGRGLQVRGEFLFPKAKFGRVLELYAKIKDKPISESEAYRSIVAGLLNTKPCDLTQTQMKLGRLIDFVVYTNFAPTPEPDPVLLKYNATKYDVDLARTVKGVLEIVKAAPYEADGVVFKDMSQFSVDEEVNGKAKTPKYAIAFKPVELWETIATKVIRVDWNPTKQGRLAPKVYCEPVKINGQATLNRYSGKNAKFIEENRIGVGATVLVMRSGDVIPDIIKTIVPAETISTPQIPYKRVGVHYYDARMVDAPPTGTKSEPIKSATPERPTGTPYTNPAIEAKILENFFKVFDIKGVGKVGCQKLADAGITLMGNKSLFNNPNVSVALKPAQTAIITDAINGIAKRLGTSSVRIKIAAASGMFANQTTSMGEDRLKLVYAKLGDSMFEKPMAIEEGAIAGIGTTLVDIFNKQQPTFVEWYKRVFTPLSGEKSNEVPPTAPTGVFSGWRIVLTNGKPQKMVDFILANGGEIAANTSKKCKLVVNMLPDKLSSNASKAIDYGIELLSADEFWAKYGGK